MVATLNQPQYQPWPFEEQVVAIFGGIHGYLDDIPTPQVPRFQDELREALRVEESIYAAIRETGNLDEDLERKLRAEIDRFKASFAVHEETGLVGATA
jgi:F-type H+-transporting ATPase subunit alpha